MPLVRPCAVCAGPGEGHFFGVFSCRCCAAFFRRSTREAREYACRANGNCPINEDGMRNSCRACRFRRCLRAGMGAKSSNRVGPRKMGQKEQLMDDGEWQKCQQIGSTNLMTPVSVPNSEPLSLTPLSQQMAKSIGTFNDRLQAICAQQLGLDIILGQSYRSVTQNECCILDRISAPLYVELVRSQFQEFDALTKSQKIKIMHDFILQFGFLACLEMTIRAFPDREIFTQMLLYPGCLMDTANDHFFEDMTGIMIEEQKKMCRELNSRLVNFTQCRYKPLAVGPLEFAAMSSIILWNCVNKATADGYDARRDLLFEELHALVSQHCCQHDNGGEDGTSSTVPIRFGKLMLLLWDLTNMVDKDFNEVVTIGNVFLDKNSCLDYSTIWENIV